MAEKLSKREFVDENPYLVYTDEEDTAYNGSGGGSIPIASADTLGGVKVGDGLSITEAGVLSASGGSGGSDVFIINGTYDDTAHSITCNKKYIDVVNTINDDKIIIMYVSNTYLDEQSNNDVYVYDYIYPSVAIAKSNNSLYEIEINATYGNSLVSGKVTAADINNDIVLVAGH